MFSGGSSYTRSSAGAFGSAAVHALVAVLLSYFSTEPEQPKEPEVDIIEFELPPEPEPEPEPEVPDALRATSPLLARAFASTGHQRSVLTQPGPDTDDPS